MSFPHPQPVTPIDTQVAEFFTPAPSSVPMRSVVRLRMRPSTAEPGPMDGAWWPRSRDPAAEFPGLVLAMSSWVGPVRQVAYHLDDWHTPTSRELVVEGWTVSLAGSSTRQANTVVVAGPDQRRMGLLVVPPHTAGDVARAVFGVMAGPDAVGSAAEILASASVHRDHGG